MANEEQLSILKQGVKIWNEWREENYEIEIDLSKASLRGADLSDANLSGGLTKSTKLGVNLEEAILSESNLTGAHLSGANLKGADLSRVDLSRADLRRANLSQAYLRGAKLVNAYLLEADLSGANLLEADLKDASLYNSNFLKTQMGGTIFGNSDLSNTMGLQDVIHRAPSKISMDTFARSKGKISEVFLRGCGLSDWETETARLYDPDLSNEEISKILYKMYDLRATQALQISPLFVSYSHADREFIDKIGDYLTEKGIRYWLDIHDMKAGRMEKQIDQAIRQSPTVLLVLSKNSLSSDWVEHEVRKARELEKEMSRDVLCPVALDDSWKDSRWPKRVMEQIMEYNILDFSNWKNDSKFDDMLRKLIDGLGLFYKG